jgi:hypothetical protein
MRIFNLTLRKFSVHKISELKPSFWWQWFLHYPYYIIDIHIELNRNCTKLEPNYVSWNRTLISLLNVAYKVCAKIITRRLNVINEYTLSEDQFGFRKGRSCSDCILIMEQFIQKRREYNLPTYVLFTDYEKAFDRVPQR